MASNSKLLDEFLRKKVEGLISCQKKKKKLTEAENNFDDASLWLLHQREVIEQLTNGDLVAALEDCAAVLKRKLESEERHLIENLEHWKLELVKLSVRKKSLSASCMT